MASKPRYFFWILLAGSALAQNHSQHRPANLQVAAQPEGGMTLATFLQLAHENNPTLKQAQAEIRAAEARQRQTGALPNPIAGYSAEDIRGGAYRGGQHGFFVEQPIVLGGKLGAAQNVLAQHAQQAKLEAEEQRLRVENGVRLLFYRALAAQQAEQIRKELSALANEAATVTRQLGNVGQADQTDVLQGEIEAQRAELAIMTSASALTRAWRELTASAGVPGLALQKLSGSLESEVPALEDQAWMKSLLAEAPTVKIAQSEIARREAEVTQARKSAVPDIRLKGGMLYNRAFVDSPPHPAGWLGFVEVGIQIPIFNRNRGGIAAAEAEVQRAQEELRRTGLVLQRKAAALWEEHDNARAAADRYRQQMLPRAQQAQELMAKRYDEMAAAYPQVLVAKRGYLQMQLEYIGALERWWSSGIDLQSFMLTDALESPARAGEMDRSIREVNLPTGRTPSPER
ncbi:MAG TPA: TolC family protein [Terriglobales bacterium]|nr:TolC family protein [Terriglobales bacterium]